MRKFESVKFKQFLKLIVMRNIYRIFCLLNTFLLFGFFSFSQTQIITEAFPSNSILCQLKNGGSGTGFMLSDSNYLYFVTARHVLIDLDKNRNDKLLDDTMHLITYRNITYDDKQDTLTLSLDQLSRDRNIQYNREYDVAVIRIAKNNSDKVTHNYVNGIVKNRPSTTIHMTPVKFVKTFDQTKLGADTYIIGYPKSLGIISGNDYDFNRPLLRKGIVAGKDKKYWNIIIDCPAYQGNSGGPVFQVFPFSNGGFEMNIIGIVSRTIALGEISENKYYRYNSIDIENSGYTVVVPIDFALELITRFK